MNRIKELEELPYFSDCELDFSIFCIPLIFFFDEDNILKLVYDTQDTPKVLQSWMTEMFLDTLSTLNLSGKKGEIEFFSYQF